MPWSNRSPPTTTTFSTAKVDEMVDKFKLWDDRIDADFKEFHSQVHEWQGFLQKQRELLHQNQTNFSHFRGNTRSHLARNCACDLWANTGN